MKNLSVISEVRMYEIPRVSETVEYILLSIIAFIIPLFLQGPQLLVGTVVNCMLIVTAINIKGMKKLIPLIVLPSISALIGGYLFGGFTYALLYMLPFIWMGNALIVFMFKYMHVQNKKNYMVSLGISTLMKVLVIFLAAFVLVQLGLVPTKFLIFMSLLQLVTAFLGGVLALPVNLIYKNIKN